MDVVGIWRYPVKSLQGEPLETAVVERDGLEGDRRWGIRDGLTGRILTARRRPELLQASAAFGDGHPVITLPGGQVVEGAGPATDRLLSEWLGSPASLVTSVEEAPGRAEYFEDATDDTSRAIEFTMPESRYVDTAALLLLTTASLRAGAALHPDGAWDPRRFRPNVLVDAEGEGFVEDTWVGRNLHVGVAVLTPTEGCVRCTMVTRPQPGLGGDRDVFRTLARHHDGRFGVWCDVAVPGSLAVGSDVALRAAEPLLGV
ncbi:MAG TPA: MOSC N-terminal beta barrel domain-containing protein [Dermatophilaceae bacterium]|nr:MOSC N-terminal beta barrel domain-containing protein [Dermatophilaceae bacterium]